MMSSPAARRIVVAVGLAVVFGIGVWMIIVPAKQGTQNQAAHNAPDTAASSDQTASSLPAPNAAAPDLTTPGASASAHDAATAPVEPPAVASPAPLGASAQSNDANVPKPRSGSRDRGQARNAHGSSMRVASAVDAKKSGAPPDDGQSSPEPARSDGGIGVTPPSTPPANDSLVPSDATRAAGAWEGNAEAKPASEPSSEGSASGADMDGRITAQVRSLVASLTPGGNIDVKATSGIVALTGSVPSQAVVEQARQAAQQVAGVRQVDTSALIVANR